jgi:hypothetical protein
MLAATGALIDLHGLLHARQSLRNRLRISGMQMRIGWAGIASSRAAGSARTRRAAVLHELSSGPLGGRARTLDQLADACRRAPDQLSILGKWQFVRAALIAALVTADYRGNIGPDLASRRLAG